MSQRNIKIDSSLSIIDTWINAKKELSPSEFGIYLYFALSKKTELTFSPQEIARTGLMDESTVRKAIKSLEKKNYIKDDIFYFSPN